MTQLKEMQNKCCLLKSPHMQGPERLSMFPSIISMGNHGSLTQINCVVDASNLGLKHTYHFCRVKTIGRQCHRLHLIDLDLTRCDLISPWVVFICLLVLGVMILVILMVPVSLNRFYHHAWTTRSRTRQCDNVHKPLQSFLLYFHQRYHTMPSFSC